MPHAKTKLYSISCMLMMTVAGIIAHIWWGMTLVTLVFIVIGLACLLPALYAWQISRGIDKVLENQMHSGSDESEQQEAGENKHDREP